MAYIYQEDTGLICLILFLYWICFMNNGNGNVMKILGLNMMGKVNNEFDNGKQVILLWWVTK